MISAGVVAVAVDAADFHPDPRRHMNTTIYRHHK